MVPAPVEHCRDRTQGFGTRDFGPSDSERDGDAPPLMNVAAGAAVLAAARGDKRARPHRRVGLAQWTKRGRPCRRRVRACFRGRAGVSGTLDTCANLRAGPLSLVRLAHHGRAERVPPPRYASSASAKSGVPSRHQSKLRLLGSISPSLYHRSLVSYLFLSKHSPYPAFSGLCRPTPSIFFSLVGAE
jgi:hypothetical protein